MTEHTQLTPRNRALEAAQKELVEFERKEKEFHKGSSGTRCGASPSSG